MARPKGQRKKIKKSNLIHPNYCSKSEAVRRLGLQKYPRLFRKLCIAKGIYPREPNKLARKKYGQFRIFYHKKDINHLMHDPVMKTLHESRVWKNKMKKAAGRKELDVVKVLKQTKPRYNFVHMIRERYPKFQDALKELDDPINIISLLGTLKSAYIPMSMIKECKKLKREWEYYVAVTHSLRKVFLSIKGIYYQAQVLANTITWISPYPLPQTPDKKVDFTVFRDFAEFYIVLLKFVIYKLYHNIGLNYPPPVENLKLLQGEFLSAFIPQERKKKPPKKKKVKPEKVQVIPTEILNKLKDNEPESEDEEEKEKKLEEEQIKEDPEEFTQVFKKKQKVHEVLFKGCTFWLGRETLKEALEFCILSFGGEVFWEGKGDITESDASITHQILDRPSVQGERIITREYLQPQWVFDCINASILLPIELYAPGIPLPPHLSPFRTDSKYVPEYKQKINDLRFNRTHDTKTKVIMENSEESDDEAKYEMDIAAEMKGDYEAADVLIKKKGKTITEIKTELKELRDSMRSKKYRKPHYLKIKDRNDARERFLALKREKLKSGLAKVVEGKVIQYVEKEKKGEDETYPEDEINSDVESEKEGAEGDEGDNMEE